MLKLYDWQCRNCENIDEYFIEPDDGFVPSFAVFHCAACESECVHQRIMSRPAQYLSDRIMTPKVYGGARDTMGYRPLPELPPPPRGTYRTERIEHHGKERTFRVANGEALMQYQRTPEYREVAKERERAAAGNARRKAMAGDIAKGKVRLDESKGDK